MEAFPAHLDRTFVKIIKIITVVGFPILAPRGAGFEPATLWLRDPRATPLGYTRHSLQVVPKIPSLPNIFRIYPTFSEFTQHFQNLPNIFRIHPPPSEFTHPLQNTSVLGLLDLFVPFVDICVDPKNVGFGKHDVFVRQFWKKKLDH